jgi:antirestriction protein ArdC
MSPKVKELYQQLKTGLSAFQQSDRWKDYLRFSTKFHHYSFGNTILIWLRKPNATRVAGFRKWHEMGRFVKAGEHGIPIFVPMLFKKKADPAECLNDEQKEDEILRGFRVGYVFDISQTDGKPIPELVKTLPQTATGETLYPKFKGLSPVPVSEEDIQINGYYHIEEKRIVIKQDLTPDQKAKTVVHEIAHATMHLKGLDKNLSREEQELVAESVAFVVCGEYGLDSSEYTFGYLSSWKGDEGKMQEIGAVVQNVAREVVGRVDASNTWDISSNF